MKKTKETKEEKTKNELEMKICEHTMQDCCQHQLMSMPTKNNVFFRIKMERMSVFFLLSFFYISYNLSILSFFCLLLYFLLHFVICILRKSVSPFLCLSTFQVINMSFHNEMWYKSLIQRILGCGDLFIYLFFLRKLKIW